MKERLIPVVDERRATTLDSDTKSRVPAITFPRLGDKSRRVAQTRTGGDNGQERTGAWHIGTGDHDMLYCDERKETSDSLGISDRPLGSPVTLKPY
jgi:hypothetical protein